MKQCFILRWNTKLESIAEYLPCMWPPNFRSTPLHMLQNFLLLLFVCISLCVFVDTHSCLCAWVWLLFPIPDMARCLFLVLYSSIIPCNAWDYTLYWGLNPCCVQRQCPVLCTVSLALIHCIYFKWILCIWGKITHSIFIFNPYF